MCVLIFWSSYIHNWVEICLQLGWNIFTTGLKYFWKSYRSQWAFIFWSRGIQKKSKMNIHNVFEIFLENLNMISIGLKYFWRSCPSHYVFTMCVFIFFHNVSWFVLISEYKNWWFPIFKIIIFEELIVQWSSNSWIFLSKF